MPHPIYTGPMETDALLNYDCRPDRRFYVTVKSGDRKGFLLGPYTTHDVALANVERARGLAEEVDPMACFFDFGTASTPDTMPEIKTRFGK